MKVQKHVENRNDFIQVKKSYIYIPLYFRIVYGITVFFQLFTLFLIIYLLLAQEFSIPSLSTLALPFGAVTAVLLSLPLGFSEQILKRLCKKWGYSRFHIIQRFALMLIMLSSLCLVGILLVTQFYELPPMWSPLLLFGLLITTCYAIAFAGFFNIVGDAVLSLKLFLKEFEKKPDEVDFRKLAFVAKRISNIAGLYNMRVSPNHLALAMTISFLDNKEGTRKDFDVLIEWVENSSGGENFNRFRKLIKRYNSIAEKSAKEGIKERYHWTFERIVKVIEVVAIPLALAIIINVVPKILEMLEKA